MGTDALVCEWYPLYCGSTNRFAFLVELCIVATWYGFFAERKVTLTNILLKGVPSQRIVII